MAGGGALDLLLSPGRTAGYAVQVLGAPLAAALLLMEGVAGLHGWQWLFIIEGAATALWGVVLAVSPWHDTLLCIALG